MISFIYMPLNKECRCFVQQQSISPFLIGSIVVQRGQLHSDVVIAGILILFPVVGVVGVWAGVEASSDAW